MDIDLDDNKEVTKDHLCDEDKPGDSVKDKDELPAGGLEEFQDDKPGNHSITAWVTFQNV